MLCLSFGIEYLDIKKRIWFLGILFLILNNIMYKLILIANYISKIFIMITDISYFLYRLMSVNPLFSSFDMYKLIVILK